MTTAAAATAETLMHEAWQIVRPMGHWKNAIDCFIFEEHLEEYARRGITLATLCEAVEYFTATPVTIEWHGDAKRDGMRFAHLTAPGYRAGPAGDH